MRSTTRRVLVARLDSAGDVLLAGPAVRAVAAAAEVVLLCGPEGTAAARLLPGVAEVVEWSCPWIVVDPDPVRPADVDALRERLADADLDEAVLLSSFHQSVLPLALVLRLAGVPRVSGISEDYPGSLLDVRVRPGSDVAEDLPEAERGVRTALAAGFPLPDGDTGELRVEAQPPVDGLVGDERYVVVHPGASAPARAPSPWWSTEAVRRLTEHGHRVVVTGGPAERGLTATVAGHVATDLGGRTSLAELAGVIAGADCVVVGNTAPAHLAAAVGTPVVSLFAPVVPAARWAPYRVPHVLLGDQHAPCVDGRARRCPVPGHPCLDAVPVADLVAAVDALIGVRV